MNSKNLKVLLFGVFCSLKVGRGCTTELTHQGYQFFSSLFDKYDEVSLFTHAHSRIIIINAIIIIALAILGMQQQLLYEHLPVLFWASLPASGTVMLNILVFLYSHLFFALLLLHCLVVHCLLLFILIK